MTERRPALPGSPRRRRGRSMIRSRHRRAPGMPVAAVLAFVLGVSPAMWWAGRDTPPAFAIGAAASLGRAPVGRATDSTLPRAGRGEPRTAPGGTPATGSAAPSSPTAGRVTPAAAPPAAPARSLLPSPPPTRQPAPRSPGSPTRPAAGTVADEVRRLTNVERARVGCAPLHADSRLAAAAQEHSTDMATRHYFSHVTPEGETPWDRAEAAGYSSPSAENIAMGYRTPAEVVAAWMQSDAHRQNILNCASRAVGVGLDSRGYYWTQLFGYV